MSTAKEQLAKTQRQLYEFAKDLSGAALLPTVKQIRASTSNIAIEIVAHANDINNVLEGSDDSVQDNASCNSSVDWLGKHLMQIIYCMIFIMSALCLASLRAGLYIIGVVFVVNKIIDTIIKE
jgi:hypothetical protein